MIAKVPGIDVLFVGPFDLGNNIGHSILDGTMHDELKQALTKVQDVAKANSKSSGIYSTSGNQARDFADQGFQMVVTEPRNDRILANILIKVSVVADMVALPAYMTSALAAAKGSYVHSALNVAKGAISGAARMTGPHS